MKQTEYKNVHNFWEATYRYLNFFGFYREEAVWQEFEDSVIIGLTDNVGENLNFR